LSIDQLRTDQVFAVIEALAEAGAPEFRPGHIADRLREAGHPMLSWEIRGELSRLEAAGLISADDNTGAYRLASSARKAG
jgi:Fe2+ or Zn2+ uptake regulation protein